MKKIILCLFCFSNLGLFAQIPSYLPTNGLVGYWPFNGNGNDYSGNGNNGTVNLAGLISDRNGKTNSAYSFNGTDNTIEIANSPSLQNISTITISAWIKISNWSTNSTLNIQTFPILCKSKTSSRCGEYSLAISPNQYLAYLNQKGGGSSSLNTTLNNWINIIATVSTIDTKFYINGILSSTVQSSSQPYCTFGYTSTDPLIIGADYYNQIEYANGIIDDIGIWNRALSQQEITSLYISCSTPTAIMTAESNTSFCQGNSVVLNATTGTNYTYVWYNNGNPISDAVSSSYAANSAGNYTVKVIDGSCNATSSPTTLTLIDTVTWTGNVDNDWHKPCNWSPEVVPECCNSVKIPLTSNSPVLSVIGRAKNITLYSTSGATLMVNHGANLQIETCPVTKTENSCPALPVITTTVPSSITQTKAISGGNSTYSGSSPITAKGVCWSTNANPTIANSKTVDGTGTALYTSNLSTLTAGTRYYVRAYATNASGTSYGNEVSFTTSPPLIVQQSYQGGVIAYLFQSGDPGYVSGEQHGIIAATQDISSMALWHNGFSLIPTSTSIGSGYTNTQTIMNNYAGESNAAKLCTDFIFNGYSDWFLPSQDELNQLYINKIGIGNFQNSGYWSSSRVGKMASSSQDFNTGTINSIANTSILNVRAIRYF